MSLSLTFNYALQIIAEPGFWQRFGSEQIWGTLNPADEIAHKGLWADQATRTLMLKPQPLNPKYKDGPDQVSSIIGLTDHGSGKLAVNAADLAAGRIFEAAIKQNTNNPFVFVQPIPGTASTVAGQLGQIALLILEQQSPVPIDSTDSRVIGYTEDTIQGNQALYLRWIQPDLQATGSAYIGFSIGQFTIVFFGDLMLVYQDTSPGQDRTQFHRIMGVPLFSAGVLPMGSNSGGGASASVSETPWTPRSFLWIPFHRNMIYVEASSGKWAIITAKAAPVLNSPTVSTTQDWNIVDDRQIMIFGRSTGISGFQIQKVKWYDQAATLHLPRVVLDYAPAAALTGANVITDSDAFHGSILTHSTPVSPPGYDNYVNTLNTCPVPTTTTGDNSRTYGIDLTFTASPDLRYSPFLYGLEIRVPEVTGTWPVASTSIGDDATTDARINHARLSAELFHPEQTRLDVTVTDESPFTLNTLQYRSHYPLILEDVQPGPVLTRLFTGITEPAVVQPHHYEANRPRSIDVDARSLWKLLDEHILRDQRDWTGTGHISVVDFIVRQAGIDTSGADYPAPLADWNMPLGGVDALDPRTGPLRKHWQPAPLMTAADFIKRIALEFSGYKVGFYPDGTFFYLPAEPLWYNQLSELTFFKSHQANPAGPCYKDPVHTHITEPEANVIACVGSSKTGAHLRSALWVDWPSILNPVAPNFIGRWKQETIPLDGVLDCFQINIIARTIWEQTRRRYFRVEFNADYVPSLRLGRVVALEGQAGLYRITKLEADFHRPGVRFARYEAIRSDETGVL
jgi:hypothetical protein